MRSSSYILPIFILLGCAETEVEEKRAFSYDHAKAAQAAAKRSLADQSQQSDGAIPASGEETPVEPSSTSPDPMPSGDDLTTEAPIESMQPIEQNSESDQPEQAPQTNLFEFANIDCPDISTAIESAFIQWSPPEGKTTFQNNDSIYGSCINEGVAYKIKEDGFAKCQGGQWDLSIGPKCIPLNGCLNLNSFLESSGKSFVDTAGLSLSLDWEVQQIESGGIVKGGCKSKQTPHPGFSITSPAIASCSDGQWKIDSDPICVVNTSCEKLSSYLSGVMNYPGHSWDKPSSQALHQEVVTGSCLGSDQPSGKVTCSNGVWNLDEAPDCGCSLSDIPNNEMEGVTWSLVPPHQAPDQYKVYAAAACDPGYKEIFAGSASCHNNIWSVAKAPNCEQKAPCTLSRETMFGNLVTWEIDVKHGKTTGACKINDPFLATSGVEFASDGIGFCDDGVFTTEKAALCLPQQALSFKESEVSSKLIPYLDPFYSSSPTWQSTDLVDYWNALGQSPSGTFTEPNLMQNMSEHFAPLLYHELDKRLFFLDVIAFDCFGHHPNHPSAQWNYDCTEALQSIIDAGYKENFIWHRIKENDGKVCFYQHKKNNAEQLTYYSLKIKKNADSGFLPYLIDIGNTEITSCYQEGLEITVFEVERRPSP